MINKDTEDFLEQEDNSKRLDSVGKDLKAPDIFDESEWNDFQTDQELPAGKSEMLWDKIQKNIQKRRQVIFYLRRLAVAASVIFIIGSVWILLKSNEIIEDVVRTEREVIQKTTVNNTTEKISFRLSDGSIVELMPQSSLSYPDTFITNKRDVILSGEATFEVAKNKSKPFTVYSDALATTALGTRFSVKSFSRDKSIRVALFEGKIVVKSADTVVKTLVENVYMIPGDVLVYNKATMKASVSHKKSIGENVNVADRTRQISPENISGNIWYMFNNQSLPEVFDQLEKIYNQKISYSNTDLKGMSFIGRLDKSDSLENILNSIALLNNLKVVKQNGGYLIKK